MKKFFVYVMFICNMAQTIVAANEHPADSLLSHHMQEVEIISTRATRTTPVAFTNIGKEEIEKKNFGQDLPYLLSGTPSIVTTSDAGSGIGYTTLRVRGTDATRINVTANGIPINDAESHNVFWVNMPDFASSIKDIQIQRGVGTSTNGAGAFGASMNMKTDGINILPYGEVYLSFGSFNTHKETVKAGTGLINEHWTFDARLSNIHSDGFLDRAETNLHSFYLQGGYYYDHGSIKLITFGGKERTYHAWNYSTKEQMKAFGRRFNSCGYMGATDIEGNVIQPEIDYDYGIAEAKDIIRDGGHLNYYNDQTDNYTQTHYQLLFNHDFSRSWNMNIGLHYTKGDGYYQEYKIGRKLIEYGLLPYTLPDGSQQKKSDLVRKKAMDNGFGGAIASANYKNKYVRLAIGGGYNRYKGHHFGNVLWVKNFLGKINPNDEYYRNTGTKDDGNIYVKAEYEFLPGWSGFADVQYRHIRYQIHGNNDKWNTNAPQSLDIDERFDFVNPKIGLNWEINQQQRLFASFSVAHKEPTRNNYTDGYFHLHPKSERLFDYELGYNYSNKWLHVGANLYYMDYKDQLVLTGELNEIGEPVAANVPESYRMGVELMAGIRTKVGFNWDINATISRNRIKNFTETLYGYDSDWNELDPITIDHGTTHIAFSPDLIFNNTFSYHYKGLNCALQSQYIGKQYMSNANVDAHLLDPYWVSNLFISYTFKLKRLKELTIGGSIYNLFNEEYENNGWASSDFTGHIDANGHVIMDQRNNYAGFAPQAGIHFMGNINIKF
jgi:iron complex outermembrane receptor protein